MMSSRLRPIWLSLPCRLQALQVVGEAGIRLRDELPIEALLASARLVAGDEQNGLALGIESEGHSPYPVAGRETKLFHVGVQQPLQRIGMRPAEPRAVVAQQLGDREQLVLNNRIECLKLALELIV